MVPGAVARGGHATCFAGEVRGAPPKLTAVQNPKYPSDFKELNIRSLRSGRNMTLFSSALQARSRRKLSASGPSRRAHAIQSAVDPNMAR